MKARKVLSQCCYPAQLCETGDRVRHDGVQKACPPPTWRLGGRLPAARTCYFRLPRNLHRPILATVHREGVKREGSRCERARVSIDASRLA